MRLRDLQRVAELESRLRKLQSGLSYRPPKWPSQPAAVAFRVVHNGRQLGRIAVADPGALSVDVYAKRRGRRETINLMVHGGDHLGPRTWQWYKWAWCERRLKVGDRVRVDIISPQNLAPNRVRRVDAADAVSRADILRELSELRRRLKADRYRKETANMLEAEQSRLPPRRYPRG